MRQDFAANAVRFGKLLERFVDRRDPIVCGTDVVVGECDDLRARGCDASVTRVRDALIFFEEVGEFFVAGLLAQLRDHVASVVGRVVIDDDHFVRSCALLVDQTIERSRQDLTTIVRSYNYRNLRLCHLWLLPQKAQKARKMGAGSGGRYMACKMCRADGDRNLFALPNSAGASRCRCRTARGDCEFPC